MKLILENWRQYLTEDADREWEQLDGYYTLGRSSSEYHPSWDYDPNEEPSLLSMEAYEMAAPQAQALATQLGLGPIALYFIEGDEVDNHLARYINGSYSSPIFVLADKVEDRDEAALTLFHELGHAYVDSTGADLAPEAEEEAVEDFARRVYAQGAEAAVLQLNKIIGSN